MHLITLDDTNTHTIDMTPLYQRSVRHRDLYLTRRRIHKRNISMLLAGFEPAIPARDRPQSYALDRVATSISRFMYSYSYNAFEFCTESTPLRSWSENERREQGLISAYVDSRPSVIIPNPFALLFYMSILMEFIYPF